MDYDMLVIGSGPAGRRAAVQSAKLGKSVLVVDRGKRLGGVSVHTGTIPSKTLRETVLNLSGWRERGFYGLAYRVKKDIEGKDLGVRLRMTLDHEIEVLEHQFARNGVKTFAGVARFADPHRLTVKTSSEEHSFEGEKIVIAVGTAPTEANPLQRPKRLRQRQHRDRTACAAQPDGRRRRRHRHRVRDDFFGA